MKPYVYQAIPGGDIAGHNLHLHDKLDSNERTNNEQMERQQPTRTKGTSLMQEKRNNQCSVCVNGKNLVSCHGDYGCREHD